MNGTPAARSRSRARDRLGELHEGERALLHPGAARCRHDDERDPLREGVLGRAGDLLADDGAHRAAHEPEVHDADRDRPAVDACRCPRPRRRACPVASWAAATRSGYGLLVDEPERIDRLEAGVALLERAVVEEHARAAPSADSRKWWPQVGQTRRTLSSCLLKSISSHDGHFVQRSGG